MESAGQKFLEILVNKEGISMKEAVKKMDYCFNTVAAKKGIQPGILIKSFYAFLNPNYDSYCQTLDPDECIASLYCTPYNDSCVPIYVKDYDQINDDPDEYINNLSTQQLKNLRDLAAHLYYNVGDSGIEDNSFDAIEYHLRKRLKKEHDKSGPIGAIPIQKLRADLPYPLPSLNKVRPEERAYSIFLQNKPAKGLVWSEKLDGVSALVVYKNGDATELYTRGDGVIGGDISYLIEYLKFPTLDNKDDIAVRGELVIKRSTFRTKYKDLYSTGRSFVVSQTNKGFITPSISDVDFVAYEFVFTDDDGKIKYVNPVNDLSQLNLYGFEIVEHGFFGEDVMMLDIALTYRERREESVYDIDGLVLDYNFSRQELLQAVNPEYKVAFKMDFTEQIRTTQVIDIDWGISKHGKYKPVAVYKPVYLSNVRIHRATAHNAAHVRDWSMGKGTIIKVTRSGDVIPQIKDVKVDEDIDPIYPSQEYKWHWDSKEIVLNDIESNPRVHQKRMLHFVNVVGVRGLGEKTIEKLYDAGYTDINKVLNATIAQLIKVRGISKVSAECMKDRLTEAMCNTPVDRFIDALTITNFTISRKLIKEVLRTFPDILDVQRSSTEIEDILKTKKIKGIGSKRFKQISEQFPKFRVMLMEMDGKCVLKALANQRKIAEKLKREGYNPKVNGKTFVFTGFKKTPYELEDYIFNNMGKTSSSVVSGTIGVITYTNMLITPKILKAREFGIPIYTQQEFRERIIGI